MKREQIIQMMAGIRAKVAGDDNQLEAFAAAIRAATKDEDAKICKNLGVYPELNVYNGGPDWYKHGKECADAILASK